jgi:NTP pyrophosphatase (non-canonical NTP hydrolase)
MHELQKHVLDFVKKYNLECSIQIRLLDLVSEMGELSKEVLKSTNYGQEVFEPTENFKEELGDTLFSIICIANMANCNLNDYLMNVLAKYEQRIKEKGDAGS